MKFKDPTMTDENGGELKAYVPPKPKRGKIPGFLKKIIRARCAKRSYAGWETDEFIELVNSGGGGWLDHWGSTVYNGEEFLISEPYPLGIESLENLIKFCRNLGLDCQIHAESYHYPTACVRIMISEKEHDSFLPDGFQ